MSFMYSWHKKDDMNKPCNPITACSEGASLANYRNIGAVRRI